MAEKDFDVREEEKAVAIAIDERETLPLRRRELVDVHIRMLEIEAEKGASNFSHKQRSHRTHRA